MKHIRSDILATLTKVFVAAALVIFVPFTPVFAEDEKTHRPVLSLPVDCQLEKDCWIQNLVDFDASEKYQDPYCGSASFNNHKGTDFRVRYLDDLERNIEVLSLADGEVVALRNSMADRLVENDADIAKIKNKECGNGVMIKHGKDWTTQICHLKEGSVRVKKGDKVNRGDVVGLMGLSGHTTFPHVHVTVRNGKTVIDPMTGLPQSSSCSTNQNLDDNSLWDAAARKQIKGASTALLGAGYTSSRVGSSDLLKGLQSKAKVGAPLIFYANFINLKAGDRIDLIVKGPNGVYAVNRGKPLPSAKSSWTVYTGRKNGPRATQRYRGIVQLYREGKLLISREGIDIRF